MVETGQSGKAVSNVGEKSFTIRRVFDAPRELVFKAFTEPEHVSRWWAPGGYTIPVCKIDLRPEGIWHYCMQSPEGDRHWARSVYREIVEPERIVYTGTFADAEANPVGGLPEHIATVTFTENEGKTTLAVHIQLQSLQELKTTLDMGMMEGLTETINNLDKVLENIQSA
ncbi:SRPBCC domain-containing protein [Virgibacillus siamensis]|uniref:SRPBCC domain-containing protein n=1 Tax=Virgibacillus siamensis TaxID=480071 RepID=UPI000984F4F8|nr:SRPBCC domain-containing protein [Virgibacillus siamensis]